MPRNTSKFHMRRKDKEIADLETIEQIIRKATICHLSLVDDDEPYVVPVNFGYERDVIYFHSALEGQKVEIIKKNNKVCFSVIGNEEIEYNGDRCKVKYRSVIGTGRAHILEKNKEKVHGLQSIMRHCIGYEYSFAEDRLDLTLVVRIDIDSMKGKQSGY